MASSEQNTASMARSYAGKPWIAPLVAAAAAFGVASVGGALTDLGPWYVALTKPWWQPPGVAFPIMWTLIFALTAISGVLAWGATNPGRDRRLLLWLFTANAVLNVAWSGLFFTLQRPDIALFEAYALWASILALIIYIWPRRRIASALLIPYLVWVTVAVALNWEIVRLNV